VRRAKFGPHGRRLTLPAGSWRSVATLTGAIRTGWAARVRRVADRDLTNIPISEYNAVVARSSTTSDVFNAIGEAHRREILDVLIAGEKAVGTIVNDLSMSQPQVSRHLRVLSEVGLVSCRAEGRRRLYRLEPARLRPFYDWLANYEQAWNERLDRMDDYLKDLQQQGEPQ
jgi:DNA-binding transcriptional ArsR family regulator